MLAAGSIVADATQPVMLTATPALKRRAKVNRR
jgi:hypothetical protein